MEPIKQSTYETCLSCCLLMLAGSDNKDEIEIWQHGWKFNYLMGQLDCFADKYGKKIKAYIENGYYYNQLRSEKSDNVELINEEINIGLLGNLLKEGMVILYLDIYFLQYIVHGPHFVVATKITGDNLEIIDPADGQIKIISLDDIEKAIGSLRNHLKYSPVLITLSLEKS